MKTIKGWKVFDSELKCRGHQFEVGKTYSVKGKIELCKNGFHFHEKKSDLFEYYDFKESNRVCEIEAKVVITGDDKSCCRTITIVKELTWNEVLNLINTGKSNTGRNNTGHRNTGHRNTGHSNTGDSNTGNRNTGDWNTGDWNTGDLNTGGLNTGNWNTGDRNTGYWNTGNWNTGDRNTGDWNTANYQSGIFNTIEQPVPIFNGAATVLMSKFKNTPNYNALFSSNFPLTEWILESDMTEKEKKENPKFYVQQGFLKRRTFVEACKIWWDNMTEGNKKLIQEIPGFSKEIFKEVTGITL